MASEASDRRGPSDEEPVLEPGHTFASVTDKISSLVLIRPYNWRWSSGSRSPSALVMLLTVAIAYLLVRGRRDLGDRQPGDVGVRDRQLRLVDRDRPRRDADLGDPAAAEAGLADVDQPVRRGDDAVRRRLRRAVPAAAHGPAVVLLLAAALPEHDGALAAVAEPAGLGRVRGLDLRDGLAAVLVRRPDPRPGDPARPARSNRSARVVYGVAGDGLARVGDPLAPLPDGVPAAGGPGHAAGRLGAHASSASTSPAGSSPAGTRRSSRPTSSPGRSTRASRW